MFRIEDLELQRLSGPVSFRFLVPKVDVFFEKASANVFLPIIILMGDVHESEADRCEPCDEEKGCYKVESKSLLRRIDKLAERAPVDFYTEYAHQRNLTDVGVLFHQFQRETIGCHDTRLRSTPLYKCDYPNVRWHYADARLWELSDKFESFYGRSDRYLYDNMNADLSVANPIEVVHNPMRIQTEETRMLFKFMSLLTKACSESYTIDRFAQAWTKVLTDSIIGNPNSIIYKQFAKYQIDVNIELYVYRTIHHGLVRHFMNLTIDQVMFATNNISPDIQHLTNLTRYMFNEGVVLQEALYNQLLKTIQNLWVYCNSALLDMYFIGRMFKTPKDNINSYLTVAFFGEAHCRAITDFLTISSDWYYVDYQASSDSGRCLRFDTDVDFNQVFERFSAFRESLQSKVPYIQKQLQELKSSRVDIDPALFQEIQPHPVPTEFSSEYLAELFDLQVDYAPDAVRLINVMAEKIIKALVRPPSDGKPVTFHRLVSTVKLYQNLVLTELLDDTLPNVYYDQQENLDPFFVQSLVRKYIGEVDMERSVIAAVGNSLFGLLNNVLSTIVEYLPQDQNVLRKQDLVEFLRSNPDWNDYPLTPIRELANS